MLKKLMKYEWKITARIFIPIYICLAVISVLAYLFFHLMDHLKSPILQAGTGFGVLIVVLGYIFVMVSPYIFLTIRFYRSTATREAYLTFTVPADARQILLSKTIVYSLWTLLTIILWLFSLACLISAMEDVNVFESVLDLFSALDDKSIIVWELLSIILGSINSVLMIFAAVSLAQLVRDHRIIASVGFYFGLYMIQQMLSIGALVPFMLKEVSSSFHSGMEMAMTSVDNPGTAVFMISIAISVVLSAVYFFLSDYMLSKKLNLL